MPRCLLLSNRLPLAYDEDQKKFVPSSGGLVSAIKGLDAKKIGYDFEWMGLITDEVNSEKINELGKLSFGDLQCHPIVIPKETYNLYYNGFCNNVIWPLFHYERSMVQHTDSGWQSYEEVNQIVADAIIRGAREDDTIWIHDFHFFLVPGMIKLKRPELKIGFFLHIPFPSSEIFRELPQRKELLISLIQCDLVGFHDLSYLTHFKSSLSRVLGENTSLFNERKWGVYPISIDADHFVKLSSEVATMITGLGVGGIAIALAIQNILGDLFSSLSIILDKPFVVGDFIIIDEWMGEVEYIGLKTTRIRSLHGEQIIISNSDLLRSRIRNMKRMHERRNSLQFALPHESSHQRIKQVVEIITAVVSSKNEVRFERCHYYKVTPTALEIEVVYFILSNNHQLHMDLQQTILLEIHQIFHEEGVIYASPTQKMHLLNKVPLEQQGSAQIQS